MQETTKIYLEERIEHGPTQETKGTRLHDKETKFISPKMVNIKAHIFPQLKKW